MLWLHRLGWGTKRIAAELGCSRTTVKRYIEAGGWTRYERPRCGHKLDGLEAWVAAAFRQHRGNAEVVRQELARQHGMAVSLRTIERAVQPLRRELRAEARATVRFETPPGKQLQIDFGEVRIEVGGERMRAHLFVATLGYSRRPFVQAFRHERQSAWLDGLEGAFPPLRRAARGSAARQRQGAGHPPRRGDARGGVQPAPARFRPLLGRLPAGLRAVPRPHQGQGRARRRLRQTQRHRRPPLHQLCRDGGPSGLVDARDRRPPHPWYHRRAADRALSPRRGGAAAPARGPAAVPPNARAGAQGASPDCSVEIDTNAYSVPWRLIGESVTVTLSDGRIRIHHSGRLVAEHGESAGRKGRIVEAAHFQGVAGHAGAVRRPVRSMEGPSAEMGPPVPELLRPLAEYEQIAGGGW
jgi:hypothetical protein